MAQEYSVYSEFDPVKHKKRFINYLEILVLETGKVVYAVPSHQMLAEQLCCEKLNLSREELSNICPEEYRWDYLNWLLSICGAIAVWEQGCIGRPNAKQKSTLRRLKLYGLYKGAIAK